jgi:flagellar basal-body rod modification protein FlgD
MSNVGALQRMSWDHQNDVASREQQADDAMKNKQKEYYTFLIEQMKNQDPTDPMDATTAAAQAVSVMAAAEQIHTNRHLEKLNSSMHAMMIANLTNNLGKDVSLNGNSTRLEGGKAAMKFELPSLSESKIDGEHRALSEYSRVELMVKNAEGHTVFRGDIPFHSGTNEYAWDGINSVGNKEDEGEFRYHVRVYDSANNPMTLKTYSRARIEGIMTDKNGNISYQVGGQQLDPSEILQYYASDAQKVNDSLDELKSSLGKIVQQVDGLNQLKESEEELIKNALDKVNESLLSIGTQKSEEKETPLALLNKLMNK